MKVVRVIGVGNSLAADDGSGPAVINQLRTRTLPEGVEAICVGADPLAAIEYLEEDGPVIIVDAVRMGRSPGTVLTFPAKSAKVNIAAGAFSLHRIDLSYALKLAEKMGLPARATIVGIEPQTVEPGRPMSQTVARAIPEAVGVVLNLLRSRTEGP